MSDSPIVLIELNVLTRDLRNGCPNWQRDLTRYLYSGDTLILYRPDATGIGRELRRKLAATPILANDAGLIVYCTRPTTCHGVNGS